MYMSSVSRVLVLCGAHREKLAALSLTLISGLLILCLCYKEQSEQVNKDEGD